MSRYLQLLIKQLDMLARRRLVAVATPLDRGQAIVFRFGMLDYVPTGPIIVGAQEGHWTFSYIDRNIKTRLVGLVKS